MRQRCSWSTTSPLRRALDATLTAEGFVVEQAATGAEAIEAMNAGESDVVLLDLGLPDIDGIEVCRHLRRWSSMPIIVLTADGAEERKVLALDEGADDYLTKPFSVPELLARLRVALRHRRALGGVVDDVELVIGDLHIDTGAHFATAGGRPLDLTRKEFALLTALARNVGKLLTYQRLVGLVWGVRTDAATQPLRTHVSLLRKKLGHGPSRPVIVNDAGVGYRLVLPDQSAPLASDPP